jgi:biotin operon repressor
MMKTVRFSMFGFALLAISLLCLTSPAQTPGSDWKKIEDAIGRGGSAQPDGAYKFSLPRRDLNVTVAGTQVKPGLALGSWVAFKGSGSGSMAMGDLVLTETEVEPVMLKLQEGGIQITALHNHVLNESPRVMYMHISGHGDATKLAKAIHDAVALTKTPAAAPPPGEPPKLDMDTAQIDQILGRQGKNNGGIYQFGVPRAEDIREGGMTIPPSMGLATAINFQPTGGGKAAITGDFVLVAAEVNPVISALRANGIEVTAIHSHMLTEEPRLFFMHFWANDDAAKLARGLRAALDKTNSKK